MSSVINVRFSTQHDLRIANLDSHLQQTEGCPASKSCGIQTSVPLMRSSSSPCIMRIPPPPWRAFQPPGSISRAKRPCKLSDDPFLTAMKECTKSGSLQIVEGSKRTDVRSLFKRGKITFSCKHGSDVREDGLVRLSQLPPLTMQRSTRVSKVAQL